MVKVGCGEARMIALIGLATFGQLPWATKEHRRGRRCHTSTSVAILLFVSV